MVSRSCISAFPYHALCVALLAGALLFAISLVRGQLTAGGSAEDGVYAPGFTVRADAVRAVRIVPLAGPALRNPSVRAGDGLLVELRY